MSNYTVTDTDLTSIADAIRSKGSTSASLVFPSGFISAISAISGGIDTSDATAYPSMILSGYTAYARGSKITGDIAFKAAETITPSITNQVISSGQYLSGDQTILGDANLLASNIASGVSIFGVVGNLESAVLQSKTITPSKSSITVLPDSGYNGLSQVTVNSAPLSVAYIYPSYGYWSSTYTGTYLGASRLYVWGAPVSSITITPSDTSQTFSVSYSRTTNTGYFGYSKVTVNAISSTYIGSGITQLESSTITPGSTNQVISKSQYLAGSQTILGDANLVPGNIAAGVSIFGVVGTVEGGLIRPFIERTLSGEIHLSDVTKVEDAVFMYDNITGVMFENALYIHSEAFGWCSYLRSAYFETCTLVGYAAFSQCTRLIDISFPACKHISQYAFHSTSMSSVYFPECEEISGAAFNYCDVRHISFPKLITFGGAAFRSCYLLAEAYLPEVITIGTSNFNGAYISWASFPKASSIYASAFWYCRRLLSLYLMSNSVCALGNSNAFTGTPIGGSTGSTSGVLGSVYVPLSLLASYQTATNWTYFSERLVGV